MSNLSDSIEELLKEMLDQNEGIVQFTRNELAEEMNCVPSQITYVIRTRFTNSMGYIKESKRGGGGSITIRRVNFSSPDQQLAVQIQAIPRNLSQQKAYLIIDNLSHQKVIDDGVAQILKAAISHHALQKAPNAIVDQIRSDILKNLMLALHQHQNTGGNV